jgi:hypothetical protein
MSWPRGKDRLRLDVRAVLQFFDEAPNESLGHATAIVAVAGEELGLALLVHYLRSIGRPTALVSDKCTPGTRSGSRLDGWVRAGDTLYQVEVKNWSAHAIGGRRLPIDADGVVDGGGGDLVRSDWIQSTHGMRWERIHKARSSSESDPSAVPTITATASGSDASSSRPLTARNV